MVEVNAAVTCDDVVVSWTADNVAGWSIEIGFPPGWYYTTSLTEASGEVTFGEPWLYGDYTVWLYDEYDEYVPGSEEGFELGRPSGCGPPNVMIAGGTGVVSPQVESDLDALAGSVTRLAGPDRYATAVELSKAHFPTPGGEGPPAYIATGENFPDALAGGPAAAYWGGPILLVHRNSIPAVTAAELTRLNPEWIDILGGAGVVSTGVETALAGYTDGELYRTWGTDRYATAAEISQTTFDPGVDAVYIATGSKFPDALAGGPAAARRGAPILLVQRDHIPTATAAELDRLDPAEIYILGGTGVVAPGVETALDAYTTGDVTRLWGPDRYATAAAVSADTFGAGDSPSMVYIATGANFPDGLTAGPIAGIGNSPILLVQRDNIPPATETELQRLAD